MITVNIELTLDELSAFSGHVLGYNLGREYSKRKDVSHLDKVMERLQEKVITECAKQTNQSESLFYNKARNMIVNSPAFEIYKK